MDLKPLSLPQPQGRGSAATLPLTRPHPLLPSGLSPLRWVGGCSTGRGKSCDDTRTRATPTNRHWASAVLDSRLASCPPADEPDTSYDKNSTLAPQEVGHPDNLDPTNHLNVFNYTLPLPAQLFVDQPERGCRSC